MSDPYAAGSVWWAQIDFNDGHGPRKKYLVLLTECPANGDQAVVALTTSRGDSRYPGQSIASSPCGCPQYSCFRIDARLESCFPVTTWVQFDNTYPISRPRLDQLANESKTGFLHSLSSNRLRAIWNCAKNARDLDGRSKKRIEAALKSPVAPAAVVVPPAPLLPTWLSSLQVTFKQHCTACQVQVPPLVSLTEVAFADVLAGTQPPPPNFEEEAKLGLEIARAGCPRCSKFT